MPEIHLSRHHIAFIEKQLEAGIYASADEVIAAGLQHLEGEMETLKRMIQDGIDDVEAGRVMDFGSAKELTTHIIEMSEERKRAVSAANNLPKGSGRPSRHL